jgi:hypothetical protein
MRNSFSFNELGGILSASKKPDVVKIASGVDGENTPVAEAMEAVCRVADVLDEMGKPDLADELITSAKRLISEKIKVAEDEEDEAGEADAEDSGEEKEEKSEVMSVKCPYCDKEFDVVVEYEDGEVDVEVEEGEGDDEEAGEKEIKEEDEGQEENGPETII